MQRLLALIGSITWIALSADSQNVAASSSAAPRGLTLEERIHYQRAIEEVYWRHRIWPGENLQAKPALEEVAPPLAIRAKVEDYLRKSTALDIYWQRPITEAQLQAEMDRMARHTKQPQILRELWEALGNDPYLIAECVARPSLADRLLRSWYAYDERYHGELKERVEGELKRYGTLSEIHRLSGDYHELEWVKGRPQLGSTRMDPVLLSAARTPTMTLDPDLLGDAGAAVGAGLRETEGSWRATVCETGSSARRRAERVTGERGPILCRSADGEG
jgi:hypothetical protein